MARAGADCLFAWLYRGGIQVLIKSDDPNCVWDTVGDAFRELKTQKKK